MCKYKLIYIFELNKENLKSLRVEVIRNLGGKSLSPFIRKIEISQLIANVCEHDKKFVVFFNNLGQSSPPFNISLNILTFPEIQSLISENTQPYLEPKQFASLKKIKNIYKYLPQKKTSSLKKGKLLNGELYVTNFHNWYRNIQIRFNYENSISPVYPIFNKLPILTAKKEFVNRDKEQENYYLSSLNNILNEDLISIDFKEPNMDFLLALTNKNWKIYAEKSNKTTVKLSPMQNSTGITWFTSDDTNNNDTNFTDLLLQAYLSNKNFIEIDNKLVIVNPVEIIKKKPEFITEIAFGNKNLYSIYQDISNFKYEKTNHLRSLLKDNFKGDLRSYQLEGLAWLRKLRQTQTGGLLADEMGLGKTIQIIAHLVTIEKLHGSHIIIAPTSVIPNWEKEILKFAPQFEGQIDCQPTEYNEKYKIIIISYDKLRFNIDNFNKKQFDTVILDEAQIVKNRNTQNYKSISQLKRFHNIILTGTPIENNIIEIWSHFLFLIPEMQFVLSNLEKKALDKNSSEFILLTSKLLKPFILRRTKKEVINDIPDKVEKDIYIDLSDDETELYQRIQNIFIRAIKTGVSGRINSIALEGLLRLRQCCVLPKMLPTSLNNSGINNSSKIIITINTIKQFVKEGRKTLIFSQFVQVLDEVEDQLNSLSISNVRLDGSTKNREIPITQFQENKDISVFLISLRAGGFGINLTIAERVILLDAWWNPAVEDQAFARAHRIGQKKKVIIIRFICNNTIEEKMVELREKKKEISDIFHNTNKKITTGELTDIIQFDGK